MLIKNKLKLFTICLLSTSTGVSTIRETSPLNKYNKPSEVAPSLSIDYCNLAFEANPYLLFAVKVEGLEGTPYLYLWTNPDGVYSYEDEDCLRISCYDNNYLINEESYFVYAYDKLAGKDMTKNVYVRATLNGVESNMVRYSIIDYAKHIFKNSDNQQLKDCVKALLEYGATCQKLFTPDDIRYANSDFITIKLTGGATFKDGSTTGNFIPGEKLEIEYKPSDEDTKYLSHLVSSKRGALGNDSFYAGEEDETLTPVEDYYRVVTLINAQFADGSTVKKLTKNETIKAYALNNPKNNDVYWTTSLDDSYQTFDDNVCGIKVGDQDIEVTASVQNFKLKYKFISGSGTYEIIGREKREEFVDIVFPDKRNGNPIKSIGENAFGNDCYILSIDTGNTIEKLGEYCFRGTNSLLKILIREQVNNIDPRVLADCKCLSELRNLSIHCTSGEILNHVTVDDSYSDSDTPSKIKIIDGFYFRENDGNLALLKACKPNGEIITPTLNKSYVIKPYAFWGLDYKRIVISPSVTEIGESNFAILPCLSSVVVGENVTSIHQTCFTDISSLVEIVNLSTLTTDSFLHQGSVANLKNKVTSLAQSKVSVNNDGFIFYNDTNENLLLGYIGEESSVTLPNTVFSYNIYNYAFISCLNINEIIVSSSVEEILYQSFGHMADLTDVSIPKETTYLGDSLFTGCENLKTINYSGTIEEWNNITKSNYLYYNSAIEKISCSDGDIEITEQDRDF